MGRTGIYPPLFSKSVQGVYFVEAWRNVILKSAEVTENTEVAGAREANALSNSESESSDTE
jgi:hypothetical protein